MSIGLRVRARRQWDAVFMQTAELCPVPSHAALLEFAYDPWPDDAGFPPDVADAVARGLVGQGSVAGRWLEGPPPGMEGARFLPASPGGPMRRLLERATHTWPADLVVARDPATVAALLDLGWAMQEQALLLLDGASPADPEPALAALRTRRRWTDFVVAAPILALLAPGVDGDVTLVAAGSEAALAGVLAGLGAALQAAGFGWADETHTS